MVHGLETFKAYFGKHVNQYAFIGGTACDILMEERGVPFRATHDLDIVLIIEALDPSFGKTFWRFVEDGGYQHRQKGSGREQFYRFYDPVDPAFPKMIELFSRRMDSLNLAPLSHLTPIHLDESIVSLSAILLNDQYYALLLQGKQKLNGYSLIDLETVILFKIRAWLDMQERREAGESIDSRNIRKHRNDVFRLLANVSPDSRTDLDAIIQADVIRFMKRIDDDPPDLKNLGLKGVRLAEMLTLLAHIFRLHKGE